ncbi:hypothetical protein [Candidatus Pantoea persica]|uniref:hypothetical protein n=1 Tax=Candidatus Pantoea persica TaxID=2518128 RepID=UPI00215DAA69|nr:hypothetical protein [Candidatus Pantoea persica]
MRYAAASARFVCRECGQTRSVPLLACRKGKHSRVALLMQNRLYLFSRVEIFRAPVTYAFPDEKRGKIMPFIIC